MYSKYVSVTKTAARRMTSILTRGLVLPLALLGALTVAPLASAGMVTNNHGSVCKGHNTLDTVFYDAAGMQSYASTAQFICPLTRSTQNTNGARIYVDIAHFGNSNRDTWCGAHSTAYNGGSIWYNSDHWTGEGFHEFAIDLTGAGKSTSWSDYVVYCMSSVPSGTPAGSVIVYGVDLNEQ